MHISESGGNRKRKGPGMNFFATFRDQKKRAGGHKGSRGDGFYHHVRTMRS